MAEKSTFIKLDRNITRWRWYQNSNTFRVFLHLIINANIADHDFESITVHRGQLAISQKNLASALDLSVQQVRTALEHLKSTGEITVSQYPKYSLITVLSYDQYQRVSTGKSTSNQHSINIQSTSNQQQLKNIKKSKNEKEYGAAPLRAQAAEEIDEEMRWAYQ